MQQNGIKSLRRSNGYSLEQKRKCSNIPGHLHQSPAAQLAPELKSIAVDWAVGLHHNRGKFTVLLLILLLLLTRGQFCRQLKHTILSAQRHKRQLQLQWRCCVTDGAGIEPIDCAHRLTYDQNATRSPGLPFSGK